MGLPEAVIYLDTANLDVIRAMDKDERVQGYTTNPTIMRKDGVADYREFVKQAVRLTNKPMSFEVLADDTKEMTRHALVLAGLGKNIYVKIPVVNGRGESTLGLIDILAAMGTKLNVTAIMTVSQALAVSSMIGDKTACILSVFAGRIADTGRNPVPMFQAISNVIHKTRRQKLLWASAREIYNVVQAREGGADIITLPPELFKKLDMFGYDLNRLSQDTARMFVEDAQKSDFKL